MPGWPYRGLSVPRSLSEETREGGSCVRLLSLPSLIEHNDFHLFPSACGGEAPIRPWDWLQSTEITKQMDIEQISVNLSWEEINRVKDGNLCVRAGLGGRGGRGGQLVRLSSLSVLLLSFLHARCQIRFLSYGTLIPLIFTDL